LLGPGANPRPWSDVLTLLAFRSLATGTRLFGINVRHSRTLYTNNIKVQEIYRDFIDGYLRAKARDGPYCQRSGLPNRGNTNRSSRVWTLRACPTRPRSRIGS